ncbi:hypothetical protein AAFP35_04960 [Gordonia sp. CPCC 206044]|uniref:hypothetical protein n=1 Tax=Gordonia sp. CPCC 206044 TaxID=3140793 RepID=UPI003AF3830E
MVLKAPDVSPKQFTDLNQAVDSSSSSVADGDLFLEPEAAANAARACAQLIDGLKNAANQVGRVSRIEGLGAYGSDKKLRDQRLQLKGTGTEDSLDKLLAKHIESVTKLRDLYIAAGRAYQDTEFEGKQKFARVDFDNLTYGTVNSSTGEPTGESALVVQKK